MGLDKRVATPLPPLSESRVSTHLLLLAVRAGLRAIPYRGTLDRLRLLAFVRVGLGHEEWGEELIIENPERISGILYGGFQNGEAVICFAPGQYFRKLRETFDLLESHRLGVFLKPNGVALREPCRSMLKLQMLKPVRGILEANLLLCLSNLLTDNVRLEVIRKITGKLVPDLLDAHVG